MAYLEIKNVHKSYQGALTLDDVSITIEKGEFVSLLGPSGVGKTTLFNILSGIENPDSGEVILDNENITGKTGIFAYMQQKDLLLPFYTVIDNVSIPLRLQGMNKSAAQAKAAEYIDEFGLSGSEKKYPHQISGGMKQRAALLRSYLYSEKLMLLDEPFSALDSITKSNLHNWYKQVAQQHGSTTFFITHDIDEALLLSDKIYVMTGPPGHIHHQIELANKPADFAFTPQFLEYKKQLLELLQ